ncbi:hypothetical protein [Pseudothauera lacus]|uniref:Uncharacterized protein n=1 Tax=Pseudothauera lacus TaxID=2136175 RepID=A0A2T4IBG4_9RHOO|nr:hypothetical protein [Pseudothauera lacus]PTD95125.1 hypothetical protein C8261_15965 [Pseudothauera lacus]
MTTPCVGIFWGIRDPSHGMALLADKTPIDRGELYGDCITHPTGHYEFWEGLSGLGAAVLAGRGLPTAPAWHEYEEFPRGRIVYWPEERRFVIYADRRLQTTAFIEHLVAEFGIPKGSYAVRSDPHYRA